MWTQRSSQLVDARFTRKNAIIKWKIAEWSLAGGCKASFFLLLFTARPFLARTAAVLSFLLHLVRAASFSPLGTVKNWSREEIISCNFPRAAAARTTERGRESERQSARPASRARSRVSFYLSFPFYASPRQGCVYYCRTSAPTAITAHGRRRRQQSQMFSLSGIGSAASGAKYLPCLLAKREFVVQTKTFCILRQ